MDEQKWFVAQAWPRDVLAAQAELSARGFEAYAPCETVERRIGRTKRVLRRPLWPGYLFVRCAPAEFAAVRETPGVVGFVCAVLEAEVAGAPMRLKTPAALPPDALVAVVLAELWGELDHSRVRAAWTPERGERVRVSAGKWRGYLGRVLSVGKRRAVMELEDGVGKLMVDPATLEAA